MSRLHLGDERVDERVGLALAASPLGAQSARAAMMGAGLTPDRIAEVVAKAGTAPIYPDQPDRPENRRITVVVLGEAPALPSDVSFKF